MCWLRAYALEQVPKIQFQGHDLQTVCLQPHCSVPTLGTHPSQEQCQVASGHLPCIVRRTSKEACQRAGCCYDNTREVPCYYGNTGTISYPSTILVPWILKRKESCLLQLVETASHPPPGEPNSHSRWQRRPLDGAVTGPSWPYNNYPRKY